MLPLQAGWESPPCDLASREARTYLNPIVICNFNTSHTSQNGMNQHSTIMAEGLTQKLHVYVQ